MTSTFAALRSQGMATEPLRRATRSILSRRMLKGRRGSADVGEFWREMIAARRAYRVITGCNIEDLIRP